MLSVPCGPKWRRSAVMAQRGCKHPRPRRMLVKQQRSSQGLERLARRDQTKCSAAQLRMSSSPFFLSFCFFEGAECHHSRFFLCFFNRDMASTPPQNVQDNERRLDVLRHFQSLGRFGANPCEPAKIDSGKSSTNLKVECRHSAANHDPTLIGR